MTLNLNKPTAGDVGWASAINQNWTDIEGAVNALPLPPRYVNGLLVQWVDDENLTVSPGKARDEDDNRNIELSSQAAIDDTTSGVGGRETKSLSGTGSANSGTNVVTGSGTAFLTELAPNDSPRTLTGTISTGGSFDTTITGTDTKFLSELAVGDLIGNASDGYVNVAAINSDTEVESDVNINLSNGSTGKAIENPTIDVGGETFRVRNVVLDTYLVVDGSFASGHTDVSMTVGVEVASTWYAAWVGEGDSAAGAFLSTQRTAPFDSALSGTLGANRGFRRVGWARNDSSSELSPIFYLGRGRERRAHNESQLSYSLSSGTATSWTAVDLSLRAPPTAELLLLGVNLLGSGVAAELTLRPRNEGGTGIRRRQVLVGTGASSHLVLTTVECPCDGAQVVDYQTGSSNFVSLTAYGWRETV